MYVSFHLYIFFISFICRVYYCKFFCFLFQCVDSVHYSVQNESEDVDYPLFQEGDSEAYKEGALAEEPSAGERHTLRKSIPNGILGKKNTQILAFGYSKKAHNDIRKNTQS